MAYSEKLIQSFHDEANQIIETFSYNLIQLEKDPDNPEIINELFRQAHSLKGSSAIMGFDLLSETAHKIEDILNLIRNGKIKPESELITFLLNSSDLFENLLEFHSGNSTLPTNILNEFNSKITKWLSSTTEEKNKKEIIVSESKPVDTPFILTDFEEEIVSSELNRKQKVLLITIIMKPDVTLKYARAFLIYTNLQTTGKIIKTVPDINLTGNDDLFSTFKILFSTSKDMKEIEDLLTDPENLTVMVIPWQKEQKTLTPTKSVQVEGAIRVDPKDLKNILDLVSELHILRNEISTLKSSIMENLTDRLLYDRFSESVSKLESISKGLQDGLTKVRMTPIEHLFKPFYKYVRDTASRLGKDIDFETVGGEILIDRTVLELLIDPLTHLIRNAISHGIENKNERIASGKNEKGKIIVSATQSGNSVIIEVSDDGRGINPQIIRDTALQQKIPIPSHELTNKDILEIICTPGFSTEHSISEISGRGVGMDIVKSNLIKMQGELELKTTYKKGTTFTLVIPLSMSIIKTLLVCSNENVLGIPISFIEKTTVMSSKEINKFPFEREGIIFLSLDEIWANKTLPPQDFFHCILLSSRGKKAGLIVSSLLREEDLVLKEMDPVFSNHPFITGGSVLGDGRVVFMLNILKIFDTAMV